MSKILLFLGSPRKHGISATLAKKVIEGAESVGAEVVTYDLNSETIKGCQGCNYCRSNDGCATKDGLASVFEQINDVTGIVAAFPIYFNSISAQSKKLIDRSYPLLDENFAPRHPGIKLVTVFSHLAADASYYEAVRNATNQTFLDAGCELTDSILACGIDAADQIPAELLDKAFEAGVKLAK